MQDFSNAFETREPSLSQTLRRLLFYIEHTLGNHALISCPEPKPVTPTHRDLWASGHYVRVTTDVFMMREKLGQCSRFFFLSCLYLSLILKLCCICVQVPIFHEVVVSVDGHCILNVVS